MYGIEYTLYLSGGFSFSMDSYNKVREFDSLMDMLGFLESWSEADCDYIKVHCIYCGERVLSENLVHKLYACA